MYHLKFSILLFSLVFGTLARGENTNIPSHSCPTAVEYTGTVLGTNETFHRFDLLVLQQKMRTKSELDKMTAFLEECVDPRKGNYYNVSYPADNSYWGEKEYTYGGGQQFVCNTNENKTTITESKQLATKLRLAAYKCHQAAGWPTATDYVPPVPKSAAMRVPSPAQPLPRSDSAPQTQRNAISDKAGPFALSPENALKHCQNEAYVSGVRGDARKAFMTECIKSATANAPQSGGVNNQSIGTSTTLKANSAVRDRPTNRPDTAPFIDPNCIDIKQTGKGISDMFKTVFSKCKVPVQVLFCFEDREKPGNDCKNTDIGWGVSSTIQPGRTDTLSSVPRSWTVHYRVCDMSNPKLLCVLP